MRPAWLAAVERQRQQLHEEALAQRAREEKSTEQPRMQGHCHCGRPGRVRANSTKASCESCEAMEAQRGQHQVWP